MILDFYGITTFTPCFPGILEVSNEFFFLCIDRDYRLLLLEKHLYGCIYVFELIIPIRVIFSR